MSEYNSTHKCYSDGELSMDSIEELALKQIQKEDQNEKELINQLQKEQYDIMNNKIDEAVEIIVNTELRCDECRCVPCAMIQKQQTVQRMVSILSKKWDITRSAGNTKIREYVFNTLGKDIDVPLIDGNFPDCVLCGVMDLIPDPISSFENPNKSIDRSACLIQNESNNDISEEQNISISGHEKDKLQKVVKNITNQEAVESVTNEIGESGTDNNSNTLANESSKTKQANNDIEMSVSDENFLMYMSGDVNLQHSRMKHTATCKPVWKSQTKSHINQATNNNKHEKNKKIKCDNNNNNSKIGTKNNRNYNCKPKNECEKNKKEWDAVMDSTSDKKSNYETSEKNKEKEYEIDILKENVRDIFDQLNNLEILLESLHEKIDAITNHIL